MAVVVETESATSRVALASAWSHQRKANLVVETFLGALVDDTAIDAIETVIVVELDVVELVVDEAPDWESLNKAIRLIASDFSKIVVLAPSAAMGDAHRYLRSAPAVLQQWWLESAAVRFGREEQL
jgi:hypothetical protein